jgi:hypothetical protein
VHGRFLVAELPEHTQYLRSLMAPALAGIPLDAPGLTAFSNGGALAAKSMKLIEPLESRYLLSLTAISGATYMNTVRTGDQLTPVVATSSTGGGVAVWCDAAVSGTNPPDGQDGSGSGIYAHHFDTSGNPVGSDFRVNTSTTGPQDAPDVAMFPDGQFVVAWRDKNPPIYGIRMQRYDANAQPIGSEILVSTASAGAGPALAIGADSQFVIVWTQVADPLFNRAIALQTFDFTTGTPTTAVKTLGSGQSFTDIVDVASKPDDQSIGGERRLNDGLEGLLLFFLCPRWRREP